VILKHTTQQSFSFCGFLFSCGFGLFISFCCLVVGASSALDAWLAWALFMEIEIGLETDGGIYENFFSWC
jgi:hypothetical protein